MAALSQALVDWLGQELGVAALERRPVGGGCCHQGWRLALADGGSLFLKTNRPAVLPQFEAEADGLAALAAAAPATLQVPRPLALAAVGGEAVLVLPWLELGEARAAGAAATGWRALGEALATLHRRSLGMSLTPGDRPGAFGWHRPNQIGTSPQANDWHDHWARFFADQRLAPQLRWLAARGQPLVGAEALLERVPQWLAGHDPSPCLVHGDLWSGNADLCADGRGVIFDPAVYRGDREVDLAMARLFGGFPEPFFTGYDQTWPLEPGHRQRQELYNLYHLLNHANLFGGGYRSQVQAAVRSLLAAPLQAWSG